MLALLAVVEKRRCVVRVVVFDGVRLAGISLGLERGDTVVHTESCSETGIAKSIQIHFRLDLAEITLTVWTSLAAQS